MYVYLRVTSMTRFSFECFLGFFSEGVPGMLRSVCEIALIFDLEPNIAAVLLQPSVGLVHL